HDRCCMVVGRPEESEAVVRLCDGSSIDGVVVGGCPGERRRVLVCLEEVTIAVKLVVAEHVSRRVGPDVCRSVAKGVVGERVAVAELDVNRGLSRTGDEVARHYRSLNVKQVEILVLVVHELVGADDVLIRTGPKMDALVAVVVYRVAYELICDGSA